MRDEKLYAERDHRALEPHYSRHVSAMTGEGLHAKSDIAAELAWRDAEIERLRALTICGCGDHFAANFEGTCPNCIAAGKDVTP